MGELYDQSGTTDTGSFSFYLLKNEALYYPRGTYTPRRDTALVEVTEVTLTKTIAQDWFLKALPSLVGEEAAAEMTTLFENRAELFDPFLDAIVASHSAESAA